MHKPNFPKLLQQFQGDLKFVSLLKVHELSPDTFGYEIKTNKGKYLVFEIDFIDSFDSLKEEISFIGTYDEFVPVKQTLKFEESQPYLYASKYTKPTQWNQIERFVNDKYGSELFYFTFLLKVGANTLPERSNEWPNRFLT